MQLSRYSSTLYTGMIIEYFIYRYNLSTKVVLFLETSKWIATLFVDKEDGWSVKMKDGSIGCHCEHTILVTEDGYEVLTLPK